MELTFPKTKINISSRHRKLMMLAGVFTLDSLFISLHYQALLDAPILVKVAYPFAVLMLAKAATDLAIFEWIRAPFVTVTHDSSGAGMSTNPKDGSVIGELLCCPWCSATWAAELLATLYVIFAPLAVVFTLILAAAGFANVLLTTVEAESWRGRLHREEAGTNWLTKNGIPLNGAEIILKAKDRKDGNG